MSKRKWAMGWGLVAYPVRGFTSVYFITYFNMSRKNSMYLHYMEERGFHVEACPSIKFNLG
jgi:hypothetical protein